MEILLREIRQKRGLSLREVSNLTGVGVQTLSDIERGSTPRLDTIELIIKGLGITFNDLVKLD